MNTIVFQNPLTRSVHLCHRAQNCRMTAHVAKIRILYTMYSLVWKELGEDYPDLSTVVQSNAHVGWHQVIYWHPFVLVSGRKPYGSTWGSMSTSWVPSPTACRPIKPMFWHYALFILEISWNKFISGCIVASAIRHYELQIFHILKDRGVNWKSIA